MHTTPDQYQDIRDAVRALCAEFPDEYHRKIDEQRGYPDAANARRAFLGLCVHLVLLLLSRTGSGIVDSVSWRSRASAETETRSCC